jgi:ABC-type phosphate transport system substrate-binding protein
MMHRTASVMMRLARGRRRFACSLPVLVLLLWVLVAHGTAKAEAVPEFRVIVHPENPVSELNREFLADAFLKRTTRWGSGETLRPVDQRSTSAVRQRFSDSVLHRSVAAVKNFWQQRIFSGRDLPPPELESDEAVVSYVVNHRGAIGYVSGNAKLDKAKPILLP